MTTKNPTTGNAPGLPDDEATKHTPMMPEGWTEKPVGQLAITMGEICAGDFSLFQGDTVAQAMSRVMAERSNDDHDQTQTEYHFDEILTLLDAALVIGEEDLRGREFVDTLRLALPLDLLPLLSKQEAAWFCELAAWVNDYAILLYEYHHTKDGGGGVPQFQGAPLLPGPRGPRIHNVLTDPSTPRDFNQLFTFGLSDTTESEG
jgi:hypothetical protein